MTINDKYNARVNFCRKLRIIEGELEDLINIKNKFKKSTGNKHATLSICIEGVTVQYNLSEKVANACLDNIENDYITQKSDIVYDLSQKLIQ